MCANFWAQNIGALVGALFGAHFRVFGADISALISTIHFSALIGLPRQCQAGGLISLQIPGRCLGATAGNCQVKHPRHRGTSSPRPQHPWKGNTPLPGRGGLEIVRVWLVEALSISVVPGVLRFARCRAEGGGGPTRSGSSSQTLATRSPHELTPARCGGDLRPVAGANWLGVMRHPSGPLATRRRTFPLFRPAPE